METIEHDNEITSLNFERQQLQEQLSEKEKQRDLYNSKPKDRLTQEENEDWTKINKEVEDMRHRLALVDEELRKLRSQ
jgi:hypothetical protein